MIASDLVLADAILDRVDELLADAQATVNHIGHPSEVTW